MMVMCWYTDVFWCDLYAGAFFWLDTCLWYVRFSLRFRVSNHADKNRMEIHNLAIMFGPSLFSCGNDLRNDGKKSSVTKKSKNVDKKSKEKPAGVQSNSHLAFNMIMQGQTVEYLLKEYRRFASLQPSARWNLRFAACALFFDHCFEL